jgi:hypothetical protein
MPVLVWCRDVGCEAIAMARAIMIALAREMMMAMAREMMMAKAREMAIAMAYVGRGAGALIVTELRSP